MVPWLQFNVAEITSAQPPQGGGQAQQEPNSAKAPMVEAEQKENPVQGKWLEAQCAGNWDLRKQTQQKALAAQSQIPEDLWLRKEVLTPLAGRTYAKKKKKKS